MTTLACWQQTITDQAGNVIPGAQIQVNGEVSGAPLASLYADRAGTIPLGNPFSADGNGFAQFFVIGGAYKVTAYLGPFLTPTFQQIWRYVGIGTSSETDIGGELASAPDGSVSAPGFAFAAEPSSGLYRVGTGELGVSILGTQILDIANSGLTVKGVNHGGSERVFGMLDAGMVATNQILARLGRSEATYDSSTWGYYWNATTSVNNFGWLGLYGQDRIIKWDGQGFVGIGRGTTNLSHLFEVGANFSVDSSGNIIVGGTGVFGTDVGLSGGAAQRISIGAAANSAIYIGQDSTHNVQLFWSYNATAGSAFGWLNTWGNNNPLKIDGSSVAINGVSGGNTSIGGTLTYAGVTLSNAVTGTLSMVLSNSPALTGTPTAPTPAANDNSTKLATTAYADAIAVLKANLASPSFTGTLAAAAITASGVVTVSGGTTPPSGGSTAAVLLFGNVSGFGIWFGTNAPTVSAAQGSIYLRRDGSSTSTRMYVNQNGATTWTNVVTAA